MANFHQTSQHSVRQNQRQLTTHKSYLQRSVQCCFAIINSDEIERVSSKKKKKCQNVKNYSILKFTQNEKISNTYSKDLPLASATFRSKEFLIAQLTIQGSFFLHKSDVGHCIFAVSTVKFFWVPRFPQGHEERSPARSTEVKLAQELKFLRFAWIGPLLHNV